MNNPFANRTPSPSGPARDIVPVVPQDGVSFDVIAASLYVEVGGSLTFVTEQGNLRTLNVPDMCMLPVGARGVQATGTTASGIHALVV